MLYPKKLGIFVKTPAPGMVKTRLVPPLSTDEACDLYVAFLRDLFARLGKLKKIDATVFYSGNDPARVGELMPKRFALEAQQGETLGDRMRHAFGTLLGKGPGGAVIVGSDSPDIPLSFVKRAFLKLKHKDVVLGPASDGGYYLIGLKRPTDPLFNGVAWGTDTVLRQTLDRIEKHELSCSLLPLWYDVDDIESLALLRSMVRARQIEHSDRLIHTERVLAALKASD